MTEKHDSRDNAARQYLAQRYYFGQLCRSAPLFLGAGQSRRRKPARPRRATPTAWPSGPTGCGSVFPESRARRLLHGQRGAASRGRPAAGLLRLAVGRRAVRRARPVLVHAGTRGRRDNWKRTLGEEQYGGSAARWSEHGRSSSSSSSITWSAARTPEAAAAPKRRRSSNGAARTPTAPTASGEPARLARAHPPAARRGTA